MESIGVPRAEIKKFADPQHWLTYFPPIAIVRPYIFLYPRYTDKLRGLERQQRFRIPYRLASILPDHRCQPILRHLRPLASQQAV